LSSVVALTPAPAQESAPADPLVAIRPALAELQKGAWTVEGVTTVIDGLIGQRHLAAAGWWIDLAEEAVQWNRLPASATATLRALAKRSADRGASNEDRKLSLQVIRHLEALVSSRNFVQARQVCVVATLLSQLAPDPPASKLLEGARSRIRDAENHDPAGLTRQEAQYSAMRPAIAETVNRRLERFQAEYAAAPCKTGRVQIKKAIAKSAGLFGSENAQSRMRDFNVVARRAESPRTLSLVVWPRNKCGVYLEGERFFESKPEPFRLQVFPGDIVQVDIHTPMTNDAPGPAIRAAIVWAKLDETPIDPGLWSLSRSGDVTDLAPETKVIEMKRIRDRNDPILKKLGVAPAGLGELGGLITKGPTGAVQGFPANADIVAVEDEFKALAGKYRWVGGVSESCVTVLEVPDL
jgi:hypothetical protein